jgi:hypothetical protein
MQNLDFKTKHGSRRRTIREDERGQGEGVGRGKIINGVIHDIRV